MNSLGSLERLSPWATMASQDFSPRLIEIGSWFLTFATLACICLERCDPFEARCILLLPLPSGRVLWMTRQKGRATALSHSASQCGVRKVILEFSSLPSLLTNLTQSETRTFMTKLKQKLCLMEINSIAKLPGENVCDWAQDSCGHCYRQAILQVRQNIAISYVLHVI